MVKFIRLIIPRTFQYQDVRVGSMWIHNPGSAGYLLLLVQESDFLDLLA